MALKSSWRAIRNQHEVQTNSDDNDSALSTTSAKRKVPRASVSRRDSVISFISNALNRRHAHPQSQSLSQQPPAQYDRRQDPQGLTTLYTPPSLPSADIIFIHGLGGSSQATWCKNHDLDLFWPSKWLPLDTDIGTARIFSFGYDAPFLSPQKGGVMGIGDFAKDLLYQMRFPPDGDDGGLPIGKRPIIFVAHSLGGLVFKQAFLYGKDDHLYKDIIASIRAAIFLSTPHRGTHLADHLNLVLRASMVYAPQKYIADLSKGSRIIEEINEQFRHFVLRLRIFSFYETKETVIGRQRVMILKKDSAVLGYPGEGSKPLAADHHGVCKFASPEDAGYKSIRAALVSLIAGYSEEGYGDSVDESKVVSEFLSTSYSVTEHDLNFFWSRRSSDTCDWILETTEYQQWMETPSKNAVLWMHAKPGRGKSVLSSYLVRHLLEQGAAVQYFFFRFGEQEKRTVSALLRSLAIQLSNQFPVFQRALVKLKNRGFNPTESDSETLWRKIFVESLFTLNLTTPIYWVIDGLDESEAPETLVEVLQSIKPASMSIRILLVGRWSRSVSFKLREFDPDVAVSDFPIVEPLSDIVLYSKEALKYLPWPEDLKARIIQRIRDKADGNFLWVHLVLEELKVCHTLQQLERILTDIPDGMEAIYKRMESAVAINQNIFDIELKRCFFIWTTYTTSSVSLCEITQILGPESPVIDLQSAITGLCGQFLVVGRDGRIRFIHETALAYLKTKSTLPFLNSHQANFDIFKKSILAFTADPQLRSKLGDQKQHLPLEYRATAWAYHVGQISSKEHFIPALELMAEFFSGAPVFIWIRLLAALNKINVLVEASRDLSAFVQSLTTSSEKTQLEYTDTDLELLQQWACDLLKLVAKFGSNLLQSPTAIYDIIPPLCPRESAIFKISQKDAQSSLQVRGQPEAWDDCVSRILFHNEDLEVWRVTCSAKYVAILTRTDTIRLWDCVTFEEVRDICHQETIESFCFSSDGRYMASYGEQTTRIWDADSSEAKFSTPSTPTKSVSDTVHDFCFAENDKKLLISVKNHRVFAVSWTEHESAWVPHGSFIMNGDDSGGVLPGIYRNCPTSMSFSPDGTKVAAIYARYPVSIWSLNPTRFLRKVIRTVREKDPMDACAYMTAVTWHPNNEEILGMLICGRFLKYNVLTDTQKEIYGGPQLGPTFLRCSSDGRFFATLSMRGMVRIYDYSSFCLVYETSASPGRTTDLHFSHDSRRLYDMREDYCNVWEPDVLSKLNKGRTTGMIPYRKHPVHDSEEMQLCVAHRHPLACTRNGQGVVEIRNYMDNTRFPLGECARDSSPMMAWSWGCAQFAYLEFSKLKLITVTATHHGPEIDLQVSPPRKVITVDAHDGYGEQMTLRPDGLLLISKDKNLEVLSTESGSRLACVTTAETRLWLDSQYHGKLLLSISQTAITGHSWEDLSEIRKWDIIPPISDPEEQSPALDKVDEKLVDVMQPRTRHLLLTVSRKTRYGTLRPRFVILDTRYLGDDTDVVTQMAVPDEVAEQIERPLNVLSDDILFFVDRSFRVCSVRMEEFSKTVWEPSGVRIKHHFFIPRDWITSKTLEMMRLTDEGTVVFPRNGELVVIWRNSLWAEC